MIYAERVGFLMAFSEQVVIWMLLGDFEVVVSLGVERFVERVCFGEVF